ncbi:hypothetical protein QJA14_25575, partial [Escherichia coli]
KDMSPYDAIRDFTMEYPTHIYDLALSNTQSRRSRAGKEFESIPAPIINSSRIDSNSFPALLRLD